MCALSLTSKNQYLRCPKGLREADGLAELVLIVPDREDMFGGMGCAYLLVDRMPALALALGVLAIPAAWLWWSYFVPEWRRWALRNGADPVELQYLAECASLVWKRGSIFARTEIRRRR